MTLKTLRHGYSTGACAAAAAKGAALMLASQALVDVVTLDLPAGISATFQLHGQRFSSNEASCYVIKDAGDDPDVTNGAEVHARISLTPALSHGERGPDILISGGSGIGRVTKPGLAVPPGEWAINPVPRRMIEEPVREIFPDQSLQVEISIPDGEERARKTLNARLGIIGGLSILGTTGIVRPISAKAWTDTIDAALDVAKACGCTTVVLSTGRSSELAAQRHLKSNPPPALPYQGGSLDLPPEKGGLRGGALPEEAFVMMGDHVAYALAACQKRGFKSSLIACQFAKLLKIACGHENTHAAASELDLATLKKWAETENIPPAIIANIDRANTAREIILATNFDHLLLEMVCRRAQAAADRFTPSLKTEFLIADYAGSIVFHGR